MEEFELKQDEVATKVSKSRASITNSLRLLKLDPRVQKMLEEEMISTGHARALLAISNKDKQYEIAQKVFDEKLSVRDIEKLVKDLKKIKKNKKEEKVYSLLDEIHPMTFENLLENSGFSAFELQHILMKFELKNIIYQIEQNVYLRKV